MRFLLPMLAVLLSAALFIQNTCPHGAAGRSLVVAGHGQCAQKQGCRMDALSSALSGAGTFWRHSDSANRFPLFLFDDPHTALVVEPETIGIVRSRPSPRPGGILPEEILKPPAV